MKTILNPQKKNWNKILERPTKKVDDIEGVVNNVFLEIQKNGDKAVAKYTEKFDGVVLEDNLVSVKEIENAITFVSEELKEAIHLAKRNITKFHTAQKTAKVLVDTVKGVSCWQEKRPIQKIGLYIPGGTAPLFSTVLMLAIPAQIAGCKEIVLCSPPNKEGKIHPAILYTANLCGVTTIIKIGGIQAIASFTFGTKSIPQVYKIFGPGNQYVTVAKQLSTKYGVAIDMPAGPSELLVVADNSANASFVASDLLSQAEHGIDSQVILVSTSKELITEVRKEIEKQILALPRIEIAQKAIQNSKSIFVENNEIALDLINQYGPEHFIICTNDNNFYIENIENAGSVFIGNYTPESAGDYASGTNHTLPTNGFSKAYSGVNLDSFTKGITFQEISKEGIKGLGRSIELMAEAEGLQAHKNAVSIRLNSLINKKSMKSDFNINNLVRENIKNIQPYSSARDEHNNSIHNVMAMAYLDANENPFNNGVNRYPDPHQNAVKEVLSKIKRIAKESILLGNGSDEVLDLIFRAFCEPRIDNIISLPPTYGMYSVLANLNAIENRKILLTEEFQPNVNEILEVADSNSKVLFLCSPNNPTGNCFNIEIVADLLAKFNGIVVIDEAYIDFATQESWLRNLDKFPNLIIIQTFSKAYALAGIRLGTCYASKEIIRILKNIKLPYNINELTQQRALTRLGLLNEVENEVKQLVRERNRLKQELEYSVNFILKVYPSDSNFLLIKVDNATKRYRQLLEYNVVVRNRTSEALCNNCLRISVGISEENEKLIRALKAIQ